METQLNQNSKNGLLSSLDIDDDSILVYLPYLFKDLWELGSAPGYKYELLNKNLLTKGNPSIIDLGCGKGAELIQVAENFLFQGTGVDIIPEFIEEANFRKNLNKCPHLHFLVDDFIKNLGKYSNFDILFYEFNHDLFGNITDTLTTLKSVIKPKNGVILFDIAVLKFGSKVNVNNYFPSGEAKSQIQSSGFDILGKIYWDRNMIIRMNNFNNNCISKRVEELSDKYPDKKILFENFLAKQINKAELLDKELDCITWLLKIK